MNSQLNQNQIPSTSAVFGKNKILELIEEGSITITPYSPELIGPASVDLKLGNEFRYFNMQPSTIDLNSDVNYKDYTEKIHVADGEPFEIPPKTLVLGITKEKISLSPEICGLLEGRSRFARMGLFVHVTAGFMAPGIENHQVLEIFNASPTTVRVYPGTPICQFIFMSCEGADKYRGSWANQEL
ncbi:hypothetical protein PCE1_001558 [Barthelona sp. PCE]